MPQDQLDALVARLASDTEFAATLAAAATPEDAQRIAAGHGFEVTSAELTAVFDGQLSAAELEAVAGGGTMASSWCDMTC